MLTVHGRRAASRVFVSAVIALAVSTSWADDSPVTVKIRDLEYGIMKVNSRRATGTHFSQHHCAGKISTRTDRIPLEPNVGFGLRFHVDSDQGSKLVIFTRWTPPPSRDPHRRAAVVAGAYVIRNHSRFWGCSLPDNDKSDLLLGDWTADVFLIGIDEEPDAALARLKEQKHGGLLLYRQTFHLYEPQ